MRLAAILFDLGDVIMQEATEVKDGELNTLRAELVAGMDAVLRALRSRGYRLGLVADTRPKTAWNVLHQHNLYDMFETLAISENVGCEKPDARIFCAALDALSIAPADYARVAMVGNNLARDIRGANALGLISIWFHWNERYAWANDGSVPKHTVRNAQELLALIDQLERD